MTTGQRVARSLAASQRAVLVVSGYGLRVAVERGHLLIEDGIANERRKLRLPRVGTDLQRLTIVGHSGTVSLDALRWLDDAKIAVVHIDTDGRLLGTSIRYGQDQARLRRAQALATSTSTGLALARQLIAAKINAQAAVLRRIDARAPIVPALTEAADLAETAETIDRLRYIEARAAFAYWSMWESVPVHFVKTAVHRTPDRWHVFGRRHSPLTMRPQRAVNPANAILNYLYSVAEAEARLACLTAGCDPAMGVIHVDKQARDSLALDLLEPIRPEIDAFVLRLLREETFAKADFFESRDGGCRLLPPLTQRLADTALHWGELLAPLAEAAALAFERSAAVRELPNSNNVRQPQNTLNKTGLPQLLRQWSGGRPPQLAPKAPLVQQRCRRCGGALPSRRRTYCDTCKPFVAAIASRRAAELLTERSARGETVRDATVRRKLSTARSRKWAEMKAWEAAHESRPNPQVFAETIRPLLANISAQALRDATGLSISHSRRVLAGRYIPHPMHWAAIRSLTGARVPTKRGRNSASKAR